MHISAEIVEQIIDLHWQGYAPHLIVEKLRGDDPALSVLPRDTQWDLEADAHQTPTATQTAGTSDSFLADIDATPRSYGSGGAD